jgi:hypothetical protein
MLAGSVIPSWVFDLHRTAGGGVFQTERRRVSAEYLPFFISFVF